ncbi:MAG: hypothetical protein Ct9H300mP23_01980 [Nitrospinota bacterium]|nr:MAG: hypothetical protein Ct9H300mP23_01980 [Nitrospinota bacterium]
MLALVALAVDFKMGLYRHPKLGHGVFFSIGGYAMGMYLMRSIGKEGSIKVTHPILWCSLIGKNSMVLVRVLITFFYFFGLSW